MVSAQEQPELKNRIRDLERALGRKALEGEILKEAIEVGREKTDIACAVAAGGRFPMKAVAETFGVSRSQLACRVSGSARRRAGNARQSQAGLPPDVAEQPAAGPPYWPWTADQPRRQGNHPAIQPALVLGHLRDPALHADPQQISNRLVPGQLGATPRPSSHSLLGS